MSSTNKRVYASFDFDNFSEAGLRNFIKQVSKSGAKVASVTATNKRVKKDGLFTKKASLFF